MPKPEIGDKVLVLRGGDSAGPGQPGSVRFVLGRLCKRNKNTCDVRLLQEDPLDLSGWDKVGIVGHWGESCIAPCPAQGEPWPDAVIWSAQRLARWCEEWQEDLQRVDPKRSGVRRLPKRMVGTCALVLRIVGDRGVVTRESNTIIVRHPSIKAPHGVLRLMLDENQWFGRLDAVSDPLHTTLDLLEILTELFGVASKG